MPLAAFHMGEMLDGVALIQKLNDIAGGYGQFMPLADRMLLEVPNGLSADHAVAIILRAIDNKVAEKNFPWRLVAMMKTANVLMPDSMFVEDPAIVLDELAVIFPLGTETRRPEATSIAQALAKFRKIARVELPGQVEGGDILRIGRRLFVGLSSRTNLEGIQQLTSITSPAATDNVTRSRAATPG